MGAGTGRKRYLAVNILNYRAEDFLAVRAFTAMS